MKWFSYTLNVNLRLTVGGLALVLAVCSLLSDAWAAPVLDFCAGFFTFPTHPLFQIRRPSQLGLIAIHVPVFLFLSAGLLLSWSLWSHEIRWLGAAMLVAYFLRAAIWCVGGNLPMVQADSAHHWSIADAVYRGRGPTLDYVASFFRVYPRFGLVDDWAMPLNAYYLAGAFVLAGNSVAVAKSATFIINLAAIPALFGLARRCYGPQVAIAAACTLAVFPPHALYASFILKESLTAFCTILAVWAFLEAWQARRERCLVAAVLAGIAAGLMALCRQTSQATVLAMILFGLITPVTRRWQRLLVWSAAVVVMVLPWAWATYRDYGTPLYSYAYHLKYVESWPDHWIYRGTPTLKDYLSHGLAPVLQSKCVIAYVIAAHFWFVFTPLLALPYFAELRHRWRDPLPRLSFLVLVAFLAGTLVNIASVDLARDFGRYFPPVLMLMLPVSLDGLIRRIRAVPDPGQSGRLQKFVAVLLVSLLWGAYDWTHDYRLLSDPWHRQLVRYQAIGEVIRDKLPSDAIVMAFHPWEVHMYSGRRTVLMPRNFDPRRLREEMETYRVTHVVLEPGMGPALGPIIEAFKLPVDFDELVRKGIGVYPVRL